MNIDNLSQIFNFDYKPELEGEQVAEQSNRIYSDSVVVEENTVSSNETPNFQIGNYNANEIQSASPQFTPPAPTQVKSTITNNIIKTSLQSTLSQIDGNIKDVEKVLKRANEVKIRLKTLITNIESSINAIEDKVKKKLYDQLEVTKEIVIKEREVKQERERVTSIINELYEKVQRLNKK